MTVGIKKKEDISARVHKTRAMYETLTTFRLSPTYLLRLGLSGVTGANE